jgi:HTH-type transcriptional regulator, cell division transcriptional repressor
VSGWFSEDMATFGDRLAAARESTGMAQGELAARLGVRDTTIAAWEADRSEPRANRLQMLAGMLDVSLVWLLTGQGKGVTTPDDAALPKEGVASLLTDLRSLHGEVGRIAGQIERLEQRLRRLAVGAAE